MITFLWLCGGLVLLYLWLRGWWFAAVLVMLAVWFWDGLMHHDMTEIPFGRLALEATVAWAPCAIRQFILEQRAKRSGVARPFPTTPVRPGGF